MADETEQTRSQDSNRRAEEHLKLLTNTSPHVLSFNEKTGKATRDSHLNATVEATAPSKAPAAPDAVGESAASSTHIEVAPIPTPAPSARLKADIGDDADSRILGSMGESASALLRPAATDSRDTRARSESEKHSQPITRVQEAGAEIRSHKEIAPSAEASPASLLMPDAPSSMASSVLAPVPGGASSGAGQQMREYSVRVPVAGHSESPATTTAREFVPGLRATTTIGYAPDEHPLPSPPERALESQVPALQATPVMLATAPDAQHVQGVPASGMQHESSGEDPLSNGGPALPATPLAAKAPGSTRISISAAAVERLHAEERKTSELNSQLDQLAARLADHKH